MSTGTTRVDSWLESFVFDVESGTYRAEFDTETTAASIAVIGALAEATDTDPTDVEPLYESIDTDALDAIIHTDGRARDAQVSFAFDGRQVTVDTHGGVAIDPLPATPDTARPGEEGPDES